jgi:hypothetical protein
MAGLTIGKSLWGVEEAGHPEQWDSLFGRIKAEGYFAVESILIFDANQNPELFRTLLDKHGLELIVQIHTASDWTKYDYCGSCDPEDHVASFRELVSGALQHRPVVINCHSGHDSWDTETAVEYFKQVLAIEKELLVDEYGSVTLVHETHRQRLLGSPYAAGAILQQPELGELKVNCDLSHWVCVCEKLFDEDDKRDKWWPEVLQLVASHCHLMHLRVGHPQGPQVPDINGEFYAKEVNGHLDW